MKLAYYAIMLMLFAFSWNAINHQDEFSRAVIASANGDIKNDPRVREAWRKMCTDTVMGTALTGEPDTTCLRAFK